jgi:hypothetical protein
MKRRARLIALCASVLLAAAPGFAQDANILLPISEVEARMRADNFQILHMRGSRAEQDRTQRVTLGFPDSSAMVVKWAKASALGETFNNQPRYEIAAYEIQKLFLDEAEFVVPPTIIRSVPISFYRTMQSDIVPTFSQASSVVVVLQYWLSQVQPFARPDNDRFDSDSVYARHIANTNVFSYLIKHSDSNVGNFLISTVESNPRVFAVDNGVAFGHEASDRGTAWRELRVKRVPARTIERLRKVTREDLDRTLGVVAQFEVRNGELVQVAPGENLSPGRGVRNTKNVIQFGLTRSEIDAVETRLQRLLKRVDEGKLTTF